MAKTADQIADEILQSAGVPTQADAIADEILATAQQETAPQEAVQGPPPEPIPTRRQGSGGPLGFNVAQLQQDLRDQAAERGEESTMPAPNPIQPSRVGEAFASGFKDNLTSQAINATSRVATGERLYEDSNFQSVGGAEALAYQLGTFADPAILLVNPATKLAGKAISFGASKLGVQKFLQQGLKYLGTGQANMAKMSKLADFARKADTMGLSKARAQAIKQYLALESRYMAMNAGATGATYSFAREAAHQVADQEFNAQALAINTAVGFGLGLGVGTVAGAVKASKTGRVDSRGRIVTTSEPKLSGRELQIAEAEKRAAHAVIAHRRRLPANQRPDFDTKARFQAEFTRELERRGLAPQGASPLPPRLSLYNQVEKFDYIDRQFGTKTSSVVQEAIERNYQHKALAVDTYTAFKPTLQRLNQLGVDNKQAMNLLRYVETDAKGVPFFNPKANVKGTNIRPEFEGQLPNDVLEALFDIRTRFNQIAPKGKGYTQGYVPFYRKPELRSAPSEAPSPEIVTTASFEQSRVDHTGFDPSKHVDDLDAVIRIYAKEFARKTAFRDLLPKAEREIFALKAFGKDDAAEALAQTVYRAFGLKDKRQLARLFADDIKGRDDKILKEVIEATISDRTLTQDVYELARNQMYNGLVFSNPRTILKQSAQPELVAGAEIGQGWVARGRVDTKARKVANEVMDLMRARDISEVIEDKRKITRPLIRGLDKFLQGLAYPGRTVFDKLDVENRRTVFAGAYRQIKTAFEKGSNLDDTLDGMLQSEKDRVIRAFQQQGEEAAARVYGIIRSRRANYAYGLVDAPDILVDGMMGRHIPFTTWGRNQAMRMVGDIEAKNPKQLASRIAKPAAILATFRAVTGYDVPGALPAESVVGLTELSPVAPLMSAAQQIPGKPYADMLTKYGEGKDAAEAFLRLKKLKGRTMGERAIEPYIERGDSVAKFQREMAREISKYRRKLSRGVRRLTR